MDLYFQGMAWANKGVNPLSILPRPAPVSSAPSRSIRSMSMRWSVSAGSTRKWSAAAWPTIARPVSHQPQATLTKAISVAPNDPWAHAWLGLVYCHTRRAEQAIAEAERALSLDRNLAHAYAGMLSLSKFSAGRAEECEAHAREGIRLSPRDSNIYLWAYMVGIAKLGLGRTKGQ